MSSSPPMLQLAVGASRYAARAEQVIALRRLARGASELAYGSVLVPVCRLAALLGLPDTGEPRHALLVAAGGSWQGLSVDAVEALAGQGANAIRPLPAILDCRHNADWATGILLVDNQPVLVLDLEAIMRTIRCNV